jgi:hypothetical protein
MIAFLAQSGEYIVTVNRLHPATLQVVISGVERIPQRRQFLQIASKRILHKVVSPTSSRGGQIGQLLGHFRRYVYVHLGSVETGSGAVNVDSRNKLGHPVD